MPLSDTALELKNDKKLYYGDPCYDSTFGATRNECIKNTPTGNLAKAVLLYYNIEIAADGDWPGNRFSACCPLDILNQDAFQCINMSLLSSLLDHELWEVYADEWGKARFVRILPDGGARRWPGRADHPRIAYCVPTMQASDIANLVIVRSADAPPFRKCGDKWYDIIDGASRQSLKEWGDRGSIFPGGIGQANGSDARGVSFTWGEVTGLCGSSPMSQQWTTSTCECGKFDQFGTIIYPDYERKQIYNDGVVDFVEIEGFEQILFWLVDVHYDMSEEELTQYTIQFSKSSTVPIHLSNVSHGDTYRGHEVDFGAVCDAGESIRGTSTDKINIRIYKDPAEEARAKDMTCTSVQTSIDAATDRAQKYIAAWDEYAVPSFFGYGYAQSAVSFNEYSKWSIVGADKCIDEPLDNIYESTAAIWGNGSPLEHWNFWSFGSVANLNLGEQKTRRTLELPNGTVWVESQPKLHDKGGYLIYSFRSQAPAKASCRIMLGQSDTGWENPFYNYMLTPVANRFIGGAASLVIGGEATVGGTKLKYPGYLFGWDDGIYTVDTLWAKVKVQRPGISIQGFGRGVSDVMNKIGLRVKPVYQVDFPAAVAAAGENWPPAGVPHCYIDVYADLKNVNQSYCAPLEQKSQAEYLQEAMVGSFIDVTLPFLYPFPDFGGGQSSPSKVNDRSAFTALSDACCGVAQFLWDYIKRFKDEPNRSYSYTCGPPASQEDVPRLGDVVDTPAGLRTVNSIAYSYNDSSSFTLTVDVGPVTIAQAQAGAITKKRTRNEEVKGKIVNQIMGALYKVDIPGIGVINAYNIDKYPWDVGDKVTVTIYNRQIEA